MTPDHDPNPPQATPQNLPEPDEHQVLADACGRFLEAICPDFSGGMPRALHRLAQAIEDGLAWVEIDEDSDQTIEDILEQG